MLSIKGIQGRKVFKITPTLEKIIDKPKKRYLFLLCIHPYMFLQITPIIGDFPTKLNERSHLVYQNKSLEMGAWGERKSSSQYKVDEKK